jgi:hypothetical protein
MLVCWTMLTFVLLVKLLPNPGGVRFTLRSPDRHAPQMGERGSQTGCSQSHLPHLDPEKSEGF